MADTYFVPTGVLVGTAETTVYTVPAATSAMVIIRFNNVDTVSRDLNVFCYTGAGPGSDVNRLLPTIFPLTSGQQYELGPLYLTAGFKVTATVSSASKINANPQGIETT